MEELPRRTALRYVQPLREGGSLPAVVDTEDGLYVAKFRGAGQGPRALVAEILVGLMARVAGLPVPELALIEVLPAFGRSEPDPEIQDQLRASQGLNLGVRFLDGAFNYDAIAAGDLIGPELAARIVWLDAYTTNPDRTARNPNLLIWNRSPWLIDHGAALYAHHDWARVDRARVATPFGQIGNHVLLEMAGDLRAADAQLTPLFTPELIAMLVDRVPDELLEELPTRADALTPGASRARYVEYLLTRLEAPRAFVERAVEEQAKRARLGAEAGP